MGLNSFQFVGLKDLHYDAADIVLSNTLLIQHWYHHALRAAEEGARRKTRQLILLTWRHSRITMKRKGFS